MVVVACLVILGVRYADADGSFGNRVEQVFVGGTTTSEDDSADDPRTRELVLSQANQFVIRFSTYGPADLDKSNKMPGYAQRVTELITPKFGVDFDKNGIGLAEQGVAQAGLARTVQLYASGLSSIDTDVATVLVAGVINQTYPDSTKEGRVEFEPLLFRWEVQLVRTEGSWLVDDFTPVRGTVEGEPSPGAATDVPTAPATVDPSGAVSGPAADPVVQRFAEIVSKREVAIVNAISALDACGFPDAAKATDTTCAAAPAAVAEAVSGLSNSLRGATNPESQVFVAVVPSSLSTLVAGAQDASGVVIDAVGSLDAACVSGPSEQCGTQRTAVVGAINALVANLRSWDSVQ